MLYVTTRNNSDAYTAFRALTTDRGPDNGVYVPFRLPVFNTDELAHLKDKSFNQRIADILNLFFSLRLNGLDLDLELGKSVNKIVAVNHKIIIAELWRNLGGNLSYVEDLLIRKLATAAQSDISLNWPKIAVKIAIIFGVYGQMLQEGMIKPDDRIDFSVGDDQFVTPMALWYCREMGLPINMIICTCGENSNLWDFIHRGTLITAGLNTDTRDGLERLVHATLGSTLVKSFSDNCDNQKVFKVDVTQLSLFNKGYFCSVAGKDRAQSVINSLYRSNSCIADPRSALCHGGLQDYRAKTGDSALTVILAEKTPLNHLTEISDATGLDTQKIKNYII